MDGGRRVGNPGPAPDGIPGVSDSAEMGTLRVISRDDNAVGDDQRPVILATPVSRVGRIVDSLRDLLEGSQCEWLKPGRRRVQ